MEIEQKIDRLITRWYKETLITDLPVYYAIKDNIVTLYCTEKQSKHLQKRISVYEKELEIIGYDLQIRPQYNLVNRIA